MSNQSDSDTEASLEAEIKNAKIQIVQNKKPSAKTKNGLDKNGTIFPPDGGWGWLVAIAAGISFLSSMPLLLQFGILFRQRFTELGWSSSQIVTLINAQQAASAITGIFSVSLNRILTFRQVSFVGAILVFIGLMATLFSNSYIHYFLSITFVYGFGKAFIFSSSTRAVNSYFKTKRKSAMTVMSSIASLGPIFLPFLSTFLMFQYGITGSVLFYAGFSLHNFISAFVYEPVRKHAKRLKGERLAENLRILHLETPPKGLDSKLNLQDSNGANNEQASNADKADAPLTYSLVIEKNNYSSNKLDASPEEMQFLQKPREEFVKEVAPSSRNRIVDYLHLDLLKDFTYFNLALGLTVIEFTENNFASVLPFILSEFKFTNIEIATSMSILGSCDMIMKFLIPYTVGKLKCDKRVIMIVSCMLICGARVVVGQSRKAPIAFVCFSVMGTNKAIRVAYGNMILPGYVAPKRLSDAIALERTIMGLFSLLAAPIIGLIPDATSYGFFVLSMNGMCVVVALLWFGEDLVRWCFRKLQKSPPKEQS
ncbi:monocarboxylate transporter 2-like [Eupeodes corollae]|uniref:monocarboxylate transporter 2-like n=1 Tax=Eupeodes corollae TaxID=290404 RepID=UPI0024929856|nr:monocarboxylate transporter 2-like [Eupeodes corollae]XP_055913191.1 monocarboxylate transporter 2-like [Eupeodes corollae]XP_055913192.1 monocarboxylate transporter 2-like [Eupeodes corollae]XP_055913194.1 monocarboxylate transporter 2-like [Eupeodes corollae]XP_055913195.1 monocarboxylate transporter 2-like [Eupeodes corollae]